MTTVRSVSPVAAPADAQGGGPGERLRRLRRRRRLFHEELLTVAVLLVALAATLVVLGLQWLDSGQSASQGLAPPGSAGPGAASAPAQYYVLGGHT